MKWVIQENIVTEDGYKIIELNTINCAGVYAADMQKLVAALVEYQQGT